MFLHSLIFAIVLQVASAFPAPVAEEVVVIVHPATSITQLERDGIVSLYLMEQTYWPDGTPVQLFDIRGQDHAKSVFYEALGQQPRNLKRSWMRLILAGEASSPKTVTDADAMVEGVAGTPGAIGYVAANAVDDRVTVVARLTPR